MSGTASSSENVTMVKEKIEAIPSAMRQMGWMVSADLMERWLHSPPWVLPPEWKSNNPPDPASLSSVHIDQRIVRMSWAMSHPRVRTAMRELKTKMANAPAKGVLRNRMAKLPWGAKDKVSFGSQNDNAVQLERTCQSNFIAFGENLDTLDDLYGGLGKAALKVALIGQAARDPQSGRFSLQVSHAGFYIRDTYDFNDFQFLGTWTTEGVLNKAQMLMNAALDGMVFRWGGDPIGNVFNHDFSSYRFKAGSGGDFVIYSDVYWERVDLLLDLA